MSSTKFKYLHNKDEEGKTRDTDVENADQRINYLSKPDLSRSRTAKGEEEYVLDMSAGPPVIPGMEPYMPDNYSFSERVMKECKRNPFIPLGLGAVFFCLGRGVYLMGRNTALSDKYMGYRIYSSLFLIGAIVGGEYYHTKIKGEKRN